MNTCMALFLEGHDMQVTSYAAPAIIKAWHLTSADFGPVFAFGLLGYFLGAPILGHLGDRKENVVGRNQFFKNSTAQ
jgi:AAHS family 4-hydroxybenzoate transporter-like MFS transporter